MKDFEQKMRQQLEQFPSPINEEKLWGNIDQALRKDRRKLIFFWVTTLLLGAFLLGIGNWYFKPTIPALEMVQHEKERIAALKQTHTFENEQPSNIGTVTNQVTQIPHSENKETRNQTIPGQAESISSTPRSAIKKQKKIKTEAPFLQMAYENNNNEATTAEMNALNPINAALQPLNARKISFFEQPEKQQDNPPKVPANTDCYTWKGARFFPYFGVYGGAQYPLKSLSAKSAEDEPLLADWKATETVLEALSAGLYGGIRFKKGLFLEAGLEYNRINERFKWNKIIEDSIGKTLIYSYLINAPGDTTFNWDTINVLRITTFEKKIYNRYQFIQIPVSLGYSWKSNATFQPYIKAGAMFNIRFAYKVERLDSNGIPVRYESKNDGNTTPFRSKIGISPFAVLGVRYQLASSLQLFGEARYVYHTQAVSNQNARIRQQYSLPGINLGLQWNW